MSHISLSPGGRAWRVAAYALLFSLVIGLGAGFQSCQKKTDASGLLKTVPSDASMVTVANLSALLEKCDCKVKDAKVEAGKEVKEALPAIPNKEIRDLATTFFSGESGIGTEVMVLFQEGYYTYLTGYISNTDNFYATIEKNFGLKFENADGVDVAGNIAVIKSQFWVNLGQHSVDALAVKRFSALDEEMSFMNNKISERLAEVEKDIEGWGNIQGIINTSNLGFQDRATAQVAIETIFTNADAIFFEIDFEKGKMEMEADVLDPKGNPAKAKYDLDKIDLATVTSIGGNADGVIALNLPAKTVAKINKTAEKGAPSMLRIYSQAVSGVDGTCALVWGDDMKGYKGEIMVSGDNPASLAEIIQNITGMSVKRDNNLLRFGQPTINGVSTVEELAKGLDGAVAGIVIAKMPPQTQKEASFIKGATILLKQSGGSLTLTAEFSSPDAGKNFLIPMLKAAK